MFFKKSSKDTKTNSITPELTLLCRQLLEDIEKIKPSRYDYYFELFDKMLNHKWADGLVLSYNDEKVYELVYYDRGQPVGKIAGSSIDEFRFWFLIHDFFVIRYRTAKHDIENMISKLYPLFNDRSLFDVYIKNQQKYYDLGEFSYVTMKFE